MLDRASGLAGAGWLDVRGRLASHPRLRRWSLRVRHLLALSLLIVAAVIAIRPASDAALGQGSAPSAPVLVAAHDLAAGHTIAVGDTVLGYWPEPLVPRGAVRADTAIGHVLAGAMRSGEVLTDVRLLGSGLAVGLAPGFSAAPVRLVDPAVVALLRTGDRVNLYALPAESAGQPAMPLATSVAVLAVLPGGDRYVTDGGVIVVAVAEAVAAQLLAAAYTTAIAATLAAP